MRKSSERFAWDNGPDTRSPRYCFYSFLEDEKRILQALKEIKDLLSQQAPQLLKVFKMKRLLTLICENFFSEMRAGWYDMPLQLQFDFRLSSALKEHLKQMGRTKFCYNANAKSHYPRVKFDLRYSEPPSSAQLTKSQVRQMRDWRIKHGQSVAQKRWGTWVQKTTRALCRWSKQPTGQPYDFGKIEEVQGETTETVVTVRRERGRKEGSSDLVQSSGDVVYLASEPSSCKIKLYGLQQDLTTATKKSRAMCFDVDVFNPLTFHGRGRKGNQY